MQQTGVFAAGAFGKPWRRCNEVVQQRRFLDLAQHFAIVVPLRAPDRAPT